MEDVIYKSTDFKNRKSKYYNHCKKWSAKLPYVSKEMEYDLVSSKFEYGFMELFNYQLNADDVFLFIQSDMEDIFDEAKKVRDSSKLNNPFRCEESRKFLHNAITNYFDSLFEQEFTDIKNVQLPFIDDVRFEILSYAA